MEQYLNKIIQGDCLAIMKTLPDNSVDAVVTDPPYGLSFMGKKWDYDVPSVEVWAECLRVLKPGGYLLSFAGTRTQHRMAVRIEDAGFEIRDMIAWIYGQGFPKSLNISDQIAKREGAKREGAGTSGNTFPLEHEYREYTQTENSKLWEGWGTALKPALEPITVARKPLSEKTVAENCLKWGTGGINIDGCRVEFAEEGEAEFLNARSGSSKSTIWQKDGERIKLQQNTSGRFPANLIHDGSDEVVGLFPNSKSSDAVRKNNKTIGGNGKYQGGTALDTFGFSDSGSAARFFYCAKSSKRERGEGNSHPTVKPIALMEYLVKLVSKEGAVILDPFAGSGSTLIAAKNLKRKYIGIEREEEYINIAEARLSAVPDTLFI